MSTRTLKDLKRSGVEAGFAFFENSGRSERLNRTDPDVSLRLRRGLRAPEHLNVVDIRYQHDPEATWGYMVKRISAHGGCLGGQRR